MSKTTDKFYHNLQLVREQYKGMNFWQTVDASGEKTFPGTSTKLKDIPMTTSWIKNKATSVLNALNPYGTENKVKEKQDKDPYTKPGGDLNARGDTFGQGQFNVNKTPAGADDGGVPGRLPKYTGSEEEAGNYSKKPQGPITVTNSRGKKQIVRPPITTQQRHPIGKPPKSYW